MYGTFSEMLDKFPPSIKIKIKKRLMLQKNLYKANMASKEKSWNMPMIINSFSWYYRQGSKNQWETLYYKYMYLDTDKSHPTLKQLIYEFPSELQEKIIAEVKLQHLFSKNRWKDLDMLHSFLSTRTSIVHTHHSFFQYLKEGKTIADAWSLGKYDEEEE